MSWYYPHHYPGIQLDEFYFTSDCICGCWMGGSRSGGPNGIDPFGNCPKHPDYDELYDRYPMPHRPVSVIMNIVRAAEQQKIAALLGAGI